MIKRISKLLATSLLLLPVGAYAQTVSERLDLPEWTKDLSVSAAFTNDSMDLEGSPLQDIDAQGVVIEVANSYNLGNTFWTQSALRGKVTNSEDEFTDLDNKSIGLTQRLLKKTPVAGLNLVSSAGIGANYGGIEIGSLGDPEDINYVSFNAEAGLTLETTNGIAPFVRYNYEVADLEDTERNLDIHSLSAGLSIIF